MMLRLTIYLERAKLLNKNASFVGWHYNLSRERYSRH